MVVNEGLKSHDLDGILTKNYKKNNCEKREKNWTKGLAWVGIEPTNIHL